MVTNATGPLATRLGMPLGNALLLALVLICAIGQTAGA